MNFKIVIVLALFATCRSEKEENRCAKGKAAAYCGSNTKVEKQYFYDVVTRGCLSYDYCVAVNETDNVLENRFATEEDCIERCIKKKQSIVSVIADPASIKSGKDQKGKKDKTGENKEKNGNASKKDGRRNESPKSDAKSDSKSGSKSDSKSETTVAPELIGNNETSTPRLRSHGYQPTEVTKATTTIDPRDSLDDIDIRNNKDQKASNKSVCNKNRPYEYCGQNTENIEAWYFDSDKNKCAHFEICTVKNTKPNVNGENQFADLETCEKTCLN